MKNKQSGGVHSQSNKSNSKSHSPLGPKPLIKKSQQMKGVYDVDSLAELFSSSTLNDTRRSDRKRVLISQLIEKKREQKKQQKAEEEAKKAIVAEAKIIEKKQKQIENYNKLKNFLNDDENKEANKLLSYFQTITKDEIIKLLLFMITFSFELKNANKEIFNTKLIELYNKNIEYTSIISKTSPDTHKLTTIQEEDIMSVVGGKKGKMEKIS